MSFVFYALAVLLFLAYKYLTKNHDYFEKKGIPFEKPKLIIGSRTDLISRKKSILQVVDDWYTNFYHEKITGIFEFANPVFIIRDPKIIKQLTIKDFDSFGDHRPLFDEKADPLIGRSLFTLKGQKWRDMRSTLSPAFTGSKMRQMLEFMSNVGKQAAETLKQQIKNSGESVFEFKTISKKITVDVIATCAYGIEVNSFENPKNDFHQIAEKLLNFASISTQLKFIFLFMAPKLMQVLKVRLFAADVTEFFRKIVAETMKTREEQKIIRNDMIHLLMEAKKGNLSIEKEKEEILGDGFATVEESHVGKSEVKRQWEDDDLTAQCFVFFFAGFDAVSTVMAFMAYEIVVNPEIQKKLHAEIDGVEGGLICGKLTYEKLQSMKYLDQVMSETLRKWPAAPMIDRLCLKDYEIEYDDKKFTIDKGRIFYVPIYGIHHDARYYENPATFDPDRFSDENKGNIDPGTYLPFGIGPRNCIGSRFALLEVKTIMYYLLLNFNFEITKKTEIPLKISPNPTQLKTKNGIWIGFSPRD